MMAGFSENLPKLSIFMATLDESYSLNNATGAESKESK